MTKTSQCLVADGHPIVRQGIKHLLLQEGPFTTVREVDDAASTIAAVRREPWQLLMLDVALPGTQGLDVLREVKRLRPPLPVLIVSLYPERELARQAFQAGASGYLTKDRAPAELLIAVRQVLAGRLYISATLADRMAIATTGGQPGALHDHLSDRELKVLRLLGRGRTVSQVAKRLNLSIKTVSMYRSRLLDQLSLRTTADLIRYAVEQRLVT